MEIIGLEIENIKKIRCISLQPKSGVIKITGKNKQGKTALLDAINMAFAGARAAGKKPIREGEDKGTIEVDLGDMIIKRTITDKANTVTVQSKDGSKFDRPQDLLNSLYNKIAFDLNRFIDMSGPEQYSLLKDCLGVGDQIEKMEADHKELFEERALLNKQIKTVDGKLHGQKADDTIGCERLEMTAIVEELEDANSHNTEVDARKNRIGGLTEDRDECVGYIEDLNVKIGLLKENIIAQEAKALDLNKEIEKESKFQASATRIDIQPIKDKMGKLEQTNTIVDRNIQVRDLKSELKDYQSETTSINERMDKITTGIKETMEALDMPIAGLTMAQGDVLFEGIPVDQISDSEKLRVSMAIGVALNPELRVILITDGSLLDDESMAEVEKLAAKNNYQIWMEIVDSSGKVGIVIEEGEVIPTITE